MLRHGIGLFSRMPKAAPWWLPSSVVDLHFATNRYFGGAASVSRASTGMVDDTAGVWSSVSSNMLRRSNKGALIEESRANGLRNNSMVGAAAGTPGTDPTNWVIYSAPAGVTKSIVGTGTEYGLPYVDARFVGTPGSTASLTFQVEANNGVAATTGQTWTASAFARIVGGSLTNVGQASLQVNENDSGGSFVTFHAGTGTTLSSAIQRLTYSTALNGGVTTAFVLPLVLIGVTSGQAIDVTIRVYAPQVELGAFATSPILTTSAAVTRAADVVTLASVTGIGPQASALVIANLPQVNGGVVWRFLEAYDGSQSWNLRCSGSSQAAAVLNADGSVALGTLTTGRRKIAGRFFANSVNVALDGTAGTADTTATAISTITRVDIGNTQLATPRFINGYIERLAIFNVSLSNAQLQALTS